MNGEEKITMVIVSFIGSAVLLTILFVGWDSYREDEISKKAIEKGYTQRIESGGHKIWVKPQNFEDK